MGKKLYWLLPATLIGALSFSFWTTKEKRVLQPIKELKVRITGSMAIPDPTNIESAGEWYYLDHISSSLAAFDSSAKKFIPMIAEKWSSQPDGTHIFKLKDGVQFHDGTPITVKDVLWSIKRHLLIKKSTHFRFWEYIKGCNSLKSLEDECEGLYAVSDKEIGIRLIEHSESFFLQMASPETGIFAASDMDPKTFELKPTKFSGPYYVESIEPKAAILKRNERSQLSQAFPNSPRTIRLVAMSLAAADDAIKKGQLDLVIRSYRPLGDPDWKSLGLNTQETSNSSILYLYGTGLHERKPVGQSFIQTLWELNTDKKINPAGSFLPFSGKGTLVKEEFLAELPKETSKKLRILCPESFFSEGFLNQLKEASKAVGSEIEFTSAPGAEWIKAFDDPKTAEKFDYILSSYASSERYPTVQLRYLAGKLTQPPIDLKTVESPDSKLDREKTLRDFQKWLLDTRQVIPLFFNRTLFVYQNNLDLGEQSSTDAEIELWRIQEKVSR